LFIASAFKSSIKSSTPSIILFPTPNNLQQQHKKEEGFTHILYNSTTSSHTINIVSGINFISVLIFNSSLNFLFISFFFSSLLFSFTHDFYIYSIDVLVQNIF